VSSLFSFASLALTPRSRPFPTICALLLLFFFFKTPPPPESPPLPLHDALPIYLPPGPASSAGECSRCSVRSRCLTPSRSGRPPRSEEHTSELQSLTNLVCRLLLEKKKKKQRQRKLHYKKTDAIESKIYNLEPTGV